MGPVAAELALKEGKGKDVARSGWSCGGVTRQNKGRNEAVGQRLRAGATGMLSVGARGA